MPYGWIVEEALFDVTAYAVVQVPDVAIVAPVVPGSRVRQRKVNLAMMFLTFFLTFGELLANFERLVRGCINAKFCK